MALIDLWSRLSGIKRRTYAGAMQVPIIDGQSLALGYNGTEAERKSLAYVGRAGAKTTTGLTRASDAAPIYMHGPATATYSATAATGLIPAIASVNAPAVFTFMLALDKWRQTFGTTLSPMVSQFNGIAGQSILEFDRDTATGTLGNTIRDNHSRWFAEVRALQPAAVPLVYGFIQGEANVSMTPAQYRAAATTAFNAALADIETAFGTRPPLLLWQTGGYVDTSAALPYGSTLAQIDLVADFNAAFAGPLYPIKLFDNQVHPDMRSQIIHTEIAAYVFARREQGVNVNLMAGTPVWSGNTVTIPYSTEGGKALVFDPVDKYAAYGGLTSHGATATGANVVSVTLSGSNVVIACDAPPTSVSIAMQEWNVSSFVDGEGKNFPAHRCDIMEAEPLGSLMVPGERLKRFIPSGRWTRP